MAAPIIHRCGACGCKDTEHNEVGGALYCQNMQCWGLPPCETVLRPLGTLLKGGISQEKSDAQI